MTVTPHRLTTPLGLTRTVDCRELGLALLSCPPAAQDVVIARPGQSRVLQGDKNNVAVTCQAQGTRGTWNTAQLLLGKGTRRGSQAHWVRKAGQEVGQPLLVPLPSELLLCGGLGLQVTGPGRVTMKRARGGPKEASRMGKEGLGAKTVNPGHWQGRESA